MSEWKWRLSGVCVGGLCACMCVCVWGGGGGKKKANHKNHESSSQLDHTGDTISGATAFAGLQPRKAWRAAAVVRPLAVPAHHHTQTGGEGAEPLARRQISGRWGGGCLEKTACGPV